MMQGLVGLAATAMAADSLTYRHISVAGASVGGRFNAGITAS